MENVRETVLELVWKRFQTFDFSSKAYQCRISVNFCFRTDMSADFVKKNRYLSFSRKINLINQIILNFGP
jgi:hypothetical protein